MNSWNSWIVCVLDFLEAHQAAIASLSTVVIAIFTIALAISTRKLWKEAVRSGDTAHLAATAARDSADAAISTYVPVLSPLVVSMDALHPTYPSQGPVEFDSYIQIVFENVGKTTAIIREVRADLFLTDKDDFPPPLFDDLPIHAYDEVIPGDTHRGTTATWRAVIELRKRFLLSQTDYSQLLAEAATGQFKRFALLTCVTYDDIFGNRHNARACIKMRRVPSTSPDHFGSFQTPRGSIAYNFISREKIPRE